MSECLNRYLNNQSIPINIQKSPDDLSTDLSCKTYPLLTCYYVLSLDYDAIFTPMKSILYNLKYHQSYYPKYVLIEANTTKIHYFPRDKNYEDYPKLQN